MNRKFSLRKVLATTAAAAALVAVVAGCTGSKDDMGGMEGMDHGDSSSKSGEFNEADVMFAQMMIPHHEQAVEIATLAETQASDPEIKEIAEEIKGAQDPEIETMTGWLKDWDQDVEASGGHDSMMEGIVSEEDMKALGKASGTEFDKLFAEHMIAHHEGAIGMAEDEQAGGENADAIELAGTIIKAQTAEIEQLNEILDRL